MRSVKSWMSSSGQGKEFFIHSFTSPDGKCTDEISGVVEPASKAAIVKELTAVYLACEHEWRKSRARLAGMELYLCVHCGFTRSLEVEE